MITIAEKLNVFSKIVIDKINKEYEEVVRRLDKEGEIALGEYKISLQNRALDYTKSYAEKGELEKKHIVAKVKMENNKHILKVKAELVSFVVDELMNRVEQFTHEDGYLKFLESMGNKINGEIGDSNELHLLMTGKDLNDYSKLMINLIQEKNDCIIRTEVLNKQYIGGFIIFNEDRTLKWDCTMKKLIDENMDFIGRRVNLVLNKSGEIYE